MKAAGCKYLGLTGHCLAMGVGLAGAQGKAQGEGTPRSEAAPASPLPRWASFRVPLPCFPEVLSGTEPWVFTGDILTIPAASLHLFRIPLSPPAAS